MSEQSREAPRSRNDGDAASPAVANDGDAVNAVDIAIDPGSAVPPYDQVRRRIAELAASGALAAGTRLPPVRQLAGDLGLAVNTVARAYRELEQAGLVQTRGRAGTVITARAARVPAEAVQAARRYAERTRALGLSPEAALELARAALQPPP